MPDQMTFNDSLSLLSGGVVTGLTTLTGTVTVDYTSNTVGGSLTLNLGGTLGLQNYTNLTLTSTVVGGQTQYTLTGSNLLTAISVTYTGQLPTSMSANVTALGLTVASGTGNVVSTVVCFVEGTLIRTPKGDVPIETLKLGDLVVTSTGAERPIEWLGHRTLNCRDHANSEAVQPIRIAANAFGDSPYQELLLSPGHAVAVQVVEEILIPANALINDATITRALVEEVTYWHLELAEHEVIFANGLPAETYIDIGNRKFFEGHGLSADHVHIAYSVVDYCRPFVTSGVLLDAVRNRLRARAMELGWKIEPNPGLDLHIVADDQIVQADWSESSARFIIPAHAENIWLVSSASVPSHISDSTDGRPLGVLIQSLCIDDGLNERRDVDLKYDSLGDGFYGEEIFADRRFARWTNGCAKLSPDLWTGCKGSFFLRLEVGPAVARWIPPKSESRDEAPDRFNVESIQAVRERAAA